MKIDARFRQLRSLCCRGILSAIVLAMGFCLAAPFAGAQSTGGRIRGTVMDPSGGAVVAANVTLINEATHATREVQSGANGEYIFLEVPVGTYEIDAVSQGFKKYARKGIVLNLNEVVSVDLTLQIGGSTEVVEVTGAPPVVDTTSTQLGAVVNERAVSQLPLNARDTYQLLQLQPGVQGVGGSDLFYGSNQSGAVSVNGGRGRSNNFNVNGGDGNDLFVNSPGIQPTPDSIAEFRVLTNTFDAEYGRNSGAVINVVTKSGTNSFHGNAYEFLRNQLFNAKGYLDLRRPDDKQNQFGGTFGGPIKKDRTFFFASYEGRRVVHGISSDPVVVPTAAERNGDFSATPFDPSATIQDKLVADVFNARCNPGASVGSAYATLFPGSIIPTSCLDPVAVDHKISDKQNLGIYYYFNDSFDAQPFTRFQAATPNLLQGFGNNNATRAQQINVSHTWTISPVVVNELRLSYFREAQGTFLHPQHTNLVTDSCSSAVSSICFTGTTDVPGVIPSDPKIGITPGLGPKREGVPFISVAGGFTIGNDFEGELPQKGNTYQISDSLTKVMGNHTTKFGVDLRNQRFFQTLFFDPNGDYSYFGGGLNDPIALDVNGNQNLFPNYLLGLPDSYLQGSAQSEDVRGNSIYLFAQDSWNS